MLNCSWKISLVLERLGAKMENAFSFRKRVKPFYHMILTLQILLSSRVEIPFW